MPALNKANRQVCDVDIRVLKTMQPFLCWYRSSAVIFTVQNLVVFTWVLQFRLSRLSSSTQ